MKDKNNFPNWETFLSVIICAAIAISGVSIAVNWLKKPSFTEEKFIHSEKSGSDIYDGDSTDEISKSDADIAETGEKLYVKIIVSAAMMHESDSVESKSVGVIPEGTKLKILEAKGRWYKVTYDEITGWVHQNTVELV